MQTKNATGVIKASNTAMRALAVGAFALGAGGDRGDRGGCDGDRAFTSSGSSH